MYLHCWVALLLVPTGLRGMLCSRARLPFGLSLSSGHSFRICSGVCSSSPKSQIHVAELQRPSLFKRQCSVLSRPHSQLQVSFAYLRKIVPWSLFTLRFVLPLA
jgi:hypothetical protein